MAGNRKFMFPGGTMMVGELWPLLSRNLAEALRKLPFPKLTLALLFFRQLQL